MRRFSRGLFPLAVAAALLFVGWRLFTPPAERAPEQVSGEEARSDYYVAGATLLRTDEQGRPELEISAKRMLHLQDNDTWLLESPTMRVFTDSGEPWHGQAESGRIWADGEEAKLLGEVRLWRESSGQNRPLTVDTQDVYLRPQQKYAETDAQAVITQLDSRLVGVGARVYLDEERLELLSNVSGRYVPTPN